MTELGVRAMLDITLDLQVSDQDGAVVLRPKLGFRVSGLPNGYAYPTTLATGEISGDGVPFSVAEANAEGGLLRIARLEDLLASLDTALAAFTESQTALGYQAIWALRK